MDDFKSFHEVLDRDNRQIRLKTLKALETLSRKVALASLCHLFTLLQKSADSISITVLFPL
jgi:hypothetical protein